MKCPICGGPLTKTVGNPETAPWVCPPDHRAFWEAELTPDARKKFRLSVRDFGHHPAVRQAAAVERERSHVRSKGAP